MKTILIWIASFWVCLGLLIIVGLQRAHAQQAQVTYTPAWTTQGLNARWVNGVSLGYYISCHLSDCSSLSLNVSPGTCFDGSGVRHAYAGSTQTLTASVTNYLYLQTSDCSLVKNTTGYPASGMMPIGTAPTSGSAITGVTQDRTIFNATSAVVTCGQLPAFTGDVTKPSGSCGTTLVNIPDGTTMAGSILSNNIAAPSTPASGKTKIFTDSTLKLLCGKNDAGTQSCTVVPDTSGTTHQFITSIIGGVIARAQPADSDISFTDITTGNSSTSNHGFIKKLDNVSTHFMDGTGGWSTPAGTGLTGSGTTGGLAAWASSSSLGDVTTPTLCGSGNYARGIDVHGNATGCSSASTASVGYIQSPTAPPTVASLTWVNQSTSTAVDASNGIFLHQPFGSTQFIAALVQTLPAAPYTATFGIMANIFQVNFNTLGIVVTDGTKIESFFVGWNGSTILYGVNDWNSATSFNAGVLNSSGIAAFLGPVLWLRIQDDSTNRIWTFSIDGFNFEPFKTVGRTTFLTATKVGIGANAQSTSSDVYFTCVSWKVTTP